MKILERPHRLPLSQRETGVAILLALSLAAVLNGCNRPQAKSGDPPAPEVEVGLPVTKQIVDYVDFTGRTEAMPTIDVRARVSGYLDKVLFREGFDVKEGDVLFLIDPRTYQADYDGKVANLAQAQRPPDPHGVELQAGPEPDREAGDQPGGLRPGRRRPRRGGGGGQGGRSGPAHRRSQPEMDPRRWPPSAAASAGRTSIRATWSWPTTRC